MSDLNNKRIKVIKSIDELFKLIDISLNRNISFHHHLRNGDYVVNYVLNKYIKEKINNLNLFPSAIFPSYISILTLIKAGQINNITTNYLNGPVAEYITNHGLKGTLKMQTHGGRARAIIEGKNKIDIAFIAAPYVNLKGDAVGYDGKNKCGSLGYAIPDSKAAKIKVLVTDNLVDKEITNPEISGENIDYILLIDKIGDKAGIVSGTTEITKNPLGVKIAKNTALLLDELGLLNEGFSFQSGAGGVSDGIITSFRDIMINKTPQINKLNRYINSKPFVPSNPNIIDEVSKEITDIQAFALASRFKVTGIKKAIIGISGGLDSTLALLSTCKAFEILGRDLKDIIAITMPGFGTTKRTKNNAIDLCNTLGVTLREIDITKIALAEFKEIGHDRDDLSVTYENVQARIRTTILMNIANKE